jgi:hypothetical protein
MTVVAGDGLPIVVVKGDERYGAGWQLTYLSGKVI